MLTKALLVCMLIVCLYCIIICIFIFILLGSGKPIPTEPPPGFFQGITKLIICIFIFIHYYLLVRSVPGVGELMLASCVPNNAFDLRNWYCTVLFCLIYPVP